MYCVGNLVTLVMIDFT